MFRLLVGRSVGLSKFKKKVGKLHFHAPIMDTIELS